MSEENKQQKQEIISTRTFSVPSNLKKVQENITITSLSKEQIINQAFEFHLKGNILEALKYYEYFLNKGFSDYRVLTNYATILKSIGKLKEAEISQRKALKLKPDHAESYANLGAILKDLGKLKDAENSTRKAIELKPNYANAYSNLGTILKGLGKLKDAEISIRKAIKINPNLAGLYSNLGNILKDLGNLEEAKKSLDKAIQLKPNMAELYSNKGMILKDLGQLKEAEISLIKAIKLKPNYANAYSNLGLVFIDIGKLKEAEISVRKAIELKRDFTDAYLNLGNILKDLGKLKEAEISVRKAIELKPSYSDAFFNLSIIQMFQDDYVSGWRNYESRFSIKKPVELHANPKIKKWDGKLMKSNEKLLIISEQGLGDTIHFMRYIPYLKEQGFQLLFCAQKSLHGLIKESNIHTNPMTPEEANQVKNGKYFPLLSLPFHFSLTQNNSIVSEPYISTKKELIEKWEHFLYKEKKPVIGISWQGNPKAEKGSVIGRSIPLEAFSEIAKLDNFSFLSLQKGLGSEQLKECLFKDKFVECQDLISDSSDFLDTAAQIQNCDLIITTDSCVAHLAAGMGKPTWVLLKACLTWRYGLKKTTFWYPSMKLFHQKEINNWKEVMSRVALELKLLF